MLEVKKEDMSLFVSAATVVTCTRILVTKQKQQNRSTASVMYLQ